MNNQLPTSVEPPLVLFQVRPVVSRQGYTQLPSENKGWRHSSYDANALCPEALNVAFGQSC